MYGLWAYFSTFPRVWASFLSQELDPYPDPHHGEKSNPDPHPDTHQGDAYPQHCHSLLPRTAGSRSSNFRCSTCLWLLFLAGFISGFFSRSSSIWVKRKQENVSKLLGHVTVFTHPQDICEWFVEFHRNKIILRPEIDALMVTMPWRNSRLKVYFPQR